MWGGNTPRFRRTGNWGIHALFLDFPTWKEAFEDSNIWDELNWGKKYKDGYRDIIYGTHQFLEADGSNTWSYAGLSDDMKNLAKDEGWKREKFPREVLIDQYAFNKDFNAMAAVLLSVHNPGG